MQEEHGQADGGRGARSGVCMEALERTRVSLGIARRLAAGHGYVDGEGGEQIWRSTALRGTGEDRDMSGDAHGRG